VPNFAEPVTTEFIALSIGAIFIFIAFGIYLVKKIKNK